MPIEAAILHADADAFFAAVEQRDDPKLRGRPTIVGGGVVMAASRMGKVKTGLQIAATSRAVICATSAGPGFGTFATGFLAMATGPRT